jgi:hypothetical protein
VANYPPILRHRLKWSWLICGVVVLEKGDYYYQLSRQW